MSISFEILGHPGRDNALLVQINSGQALHRVLFDCGESCLSEVSFADIQSIDHLFFSHLHMDHVAGFDHYFRALFNRTSKPNQIWGPTGTRQILQNRFRGYLWNLHGEMNASWIVADVDEFTIHSSRYELSEAFEAEHAEQAQPTNLVVLDGTDYSVEAVVMDHKTPSLAYVLREKPRTNIDTSRLEAMGLRPGPWMKELKGSNPQIDEIVIAGVTHSLPALREALVVESQGDSIAYLTDFLLDDSAIDRLVPKLAGCRVVVCEAQYRQSDIELALRNYHMTTVRTAQLAKRAGIEELILFHLSDRYQPSDWEEMLSEARAIFPNTKYPAKWKLG
jgi:ribonuclease Z